MRVQAAVASSPQRPPPAPRKRIVVSPATFILAWWLIFIGHFVCFVVIFTLAGFQALTAEPEAYMYTGTALQIPHMWLVLGARACLVVALLHLFALLRMVIFSFRRGQLCFRTASASAANRSARHQSAHRSFMQAVLLPVQLIRRWWGKIYGIDGVLGLNGPYFDVIYRVREILEMLSQTYQAYYLSILVTSAWINHFAVAVISVGCVSTPIIHRLFRKNDSLRRFICVVVDTVLDVSSSITIPVLVIGRTLRDMDWNTFIFPVELVYDNVWMTMATAQARLLYVWSTIDFLSTLVLQLSVLGCLLTIASGMERRRPAKRGTSAKPLQKPAPTASGAGPAPPLQSQPTRSAVAVAYPPISRLRRTLRFLLDVVFFAWGVTILSVHLYSNRFNTEDVFPSCALGTHKWFSRKPGCSIVWINCHRLGITGRTDEVEAVLRLYEASTITGLSVLHCTDFTMPDYFEQLTEIRSVELSNVTLTNWPMTAAVHRDVHPYMGHVSLGYVNLTEFPPALLHPQLPMAFTDLDVTFTNLTTLPDAVGECWGDRLWLRINIEHAQLTALPASLARVPILRFSLIGNNLTEIQDGLFQYQQLAELYVSGNPLTRLPKTIGDTSRLLRLFGEHTLINETNDWWASALTVDVRMYGSPVCGGSGASAAASPLSGAMRQRACKEDTGTVFGTFPWAAVWKLRPVE